ncbi:acyltransferase family protein [Microbacterium sp.]|uniref:acyltransferase family protein n=1 Tax=Microbacterium sp. TaxID=51671 RepID=UPI003A88161A
MTITGQRPLEALRTLPSIRSFRPDVEGLRAVAVLTVVLYHAGVPALGGGYVGVSVFFVISGFLITLHLTQEVARTGTIRIGRFYARRARRLLPAAALVLITTVIVSWAMVSGLLGADVGVDAFWAAIFAANIRFALEGVDYQANQEPSLVQHYWSLSVEEQFYLFWPVVILVVCVIGARLVPRVDRRVWIICAIAVFGGFSFWYSQQLMAESSTLAYFLMPSRAWELGLGALVAAGAPWLVRLRMLQNGFVVAVGLVMILAASTVFNDETPYPGTASLLPTMGTALVIAAGLRASTAPEKFFLSRRPFQFIGRLSYSLYLWHWPALMLAPLILDQRMGVLENVIVCALALVLSMFSFVAIEEPFRTDARLQRSTGKSLLVGAVAIALTAAVAVAALFAGPLPYRTGEAVSPADRDEIVAAVEAAAETTKVPGNLSPSLDKASKDKPDLEAADGISCMVSLQESAVSAEPGGSCVAGGTEDGSETVVLVGDSHAYQWMPALREIAKQRDWRLVSLTKGGCAFWDVELINTNLKRDFRECYQWRENALERIEEENPTTIITTAAIFNPRPGDFAERWVAGVSTGVDTLVGTGAEVIVLEDTPYPKVDIPTCLSRNMTNTPECVLTPEEAYSDNGRREASAAAAATAGATVIDPYRWFCTTSACPVIVGNTVVFTDNSHVSSTYSTLLANVLGKELPQ